MSLLEKSKQLISSVAPDGWMWRRDYAGGGYSTELCNTKQQAEALLERFKEGGTVDSIQSLYSRETVESLLSQCRKEARDQALLEAAEICSGIATANMGSEESEGSLWCEDELRRMRREA